MRPPPAPGPAKAASRAVLSGLVLLSLLITMVGGYTLSRDDLLEAMVAKRKGKEHSNSPHKEDPEIAVCDKQLKRGNKCGARPLCCQGSTCQMFNSMYRTFMDCPHGVKNEECFCIEESLASRTDFSEYQ